MRILFSRIQHFWAVGRAVLTHACFVVVLSHHSYSDSGHCLSSARCSHLPYSQLKRNGDTFCSVYFWNWYFSFFLFPSFPVFPIALFSPLFAFFISLIFPNSALKSLTLKTKNKRAIHLPSANTLTDAAYKPSCEIKQTCNISHQKPFFSLCLCFYTVLFSLDYIIPLWRL